MRNLVPLTKILLTLGTAVWAIIFREPFSLALLPVGFLPCSLLLQPFRRCLCFLCLYLGNFLRRVVDIDLPNIVKVNINLLGSCPVNALRFINHDFVYEFIEHQIGDLRRIFALADQRYKLLNIPGFFSFLRESAFDCVHS